MKNFILIGLLLFMSMCKSPGNKSHVTAYKSIHIDTSRYAVLKFDTIAKLYGIFEKNYKPAVLSDVEIAEIQDLLTKRVMQYNDTAYSAYKKDSIESKKRHPGSTAYDGRIIHPEKYYHQLIAAINSKGQKEVWINCFCDTYLIPSHSDRSYWRKHIFMVMDGGACFFHLRINLGTKTIYRFYVNSVA